MHVVQSPRGFHCDAPCRGGDSILHVVLSHLPGAQGLTPTENQEPRPSTAGHSPAQAPDGGSVWWPLAKTGRGPVSGVPSLSVHVDGRRQAQDKAPGCCNGPWITLRDFSLGTGVLQAHASL